jgi:hypothetical protein
MAYSINPYITTVASDSFSVQSNGVIQGTSQPDNATMWGLAQGALKVTETLPMWGGCAISVYSPPVNFGANNTTVARATGIANTIGFSVFDQGGSYIVTGSSNVPTVQPPGDVMYYTLGSRARIAVAADPSLVSLDGGLLNQQVSWDFNNQRLQPYTATATVAITSMTATFSDGVYTIAVVAAAPTVVGAVGDAINISGATNSGTGGNTLVNGNFIVTSFTSNTSFSFQVIATSGQIATIGVGSAVLNQGTGILPVSLLAVYSANSKIVQYDPVTGFVNFNNSGTAAIIRI